MQGLQYTLIDLQGCLKYTIITVCVILDLIGAILSATAVGVGEYVYCLLLVNRSDELIIMSINSV